MRVHGYAYAILERMKGGQKAQGFTIVEVMIVLAVSGALFISAAALIAGRQNQTEFDQGIRQIQSQIQQTANDVASGYYPNLKNFKCTPSSGGPVISSGSSEQGTSSGCTFLGKILQFNSTSGPQPNQFAMFTVAGLQQGSSGTEATSFAQAKPIAVAPSTTNPNVPDITDKQPLQYGLNVSYMKYNGTTNIGSVGFMSSFASYNSSGFLASGSQQVDVVPIAGSTLTDNASTAAEKINTKLAASSVDPSGGVAICFASATTNESGLITLGNNGRQLSVTLDIKEGNTQCM